MGGTGVRLRLVQASENLGISMQSAYKHFSRHESEDGEAHFLFGVAVAEKDHYRQLMEEVDRLAAEAHTEIYRAGDYDAADARMLEKYREQFEQDENQTRQIEHDLDWALE